MTSHQWRIFWLQASELSYESMKRELCFSHTNTELSYISGRSRGGACSPPLLLERLDPPLLMIQSSVVHDTVLFLWKTGVIPPYRDAHQFVIQQRREHVNDLKHALIVMRKISDEDELSFQLSMMYLLEEGALRFVNLPKVIMFIKPMKLLVMDREGLLGSFYVSGKLPAYPTRKPTLTLTSHVG